MSEVFANKLLFEHKKNSKQRKTRLDKAVSSLPLNTDIFYVKNIKVLRNKPAGINAFAIYGYHDMQQAAFRRSQGVDNLFHVLHTNVPSVRASDIGERCGIKRFLKSLGITYEIPDERQRIFNIGNMIEEKMIGGGEILLYVDKDGSVLLNGETPFNEYVEQYEILTDKPVSRGRWYMAKVKGKKDVSWLAEDGWVFRHNYGDKEGFIYVIFDNQGRGGVLTGHYDFILLKPSNWDRITAGQDSFPVYTGEENSWVMCDVKTMNSRVFAKICSSSIAVQKPEYDIQTLLYQSALPKGMNVESRAVFAFNKGVQSDAVDPEAFCNKEYAIFPFTERFQHIEEVIEKAYSTLAKQSPVDLDMREMDTQFCNWCDYKDDCMNVLIHMTQADTDAIEERYVRPKQEGVLRELKKCVRLISARTGKELDVEQLTQQLVQQAQQKNNVSAVIER
jgi:hypothetical protein